MKKLVFAITFLVLSTSFAFAGSKSEKLDANTLKITRPSSDQPAVSANYDYDFLIDQRQRIIADAVDYAAKRKAELDEVNGLIAQADKLGIVSKRKKEVLIPPVPPQAGPVQSTKSTQSTQSTQTVQPTKQPIEENQIPPNPPQAGQKKSEAKDKKKYGIIW